MRRVYRLLRLRDIKPSLKDTEVHILWPEDGTWYMADIKKVHVRARVCVQCWVAVAAEAAAAAAAAAPVSRWPRLCTSSSCAVEAPASCDAGSPPALPQRQDDMPHTHAAGAQDHDCVCGVPADE
jgi:hypothetical protein